MLSPEEATALKKRNYRSIREMVFVSFTVGVNLMKPSRLGNALKLWNIVLLLSTTISMYGHYHRFIYYIHDITRMVESVCTAFQTATSILKMAYCLFVQQKFYVMLRNACSHQMLLDCEIFHTDFPVNAQLKLQIDEIMSRQWKSTRRQLLFYLYCCIAILSNYTADSYGHNLYYYYTASNTDWEIRLPLPSLYPGWQEKRMQFPYYHIQMYLESCSLYIAGMTAFSFETLFIVLCLHGVGLVKALVCMIESSTSPLVPRERRLEYLRYCIYQYQRLAAYALEINNMYRHLLLIQFALSLFTWGLVLFQMGVGLSSDKSTLMRMVLYLAAAGYQIVIYCYNGQRFASASEEIPLAFYKCLWYEESREFRRFVMMMLMRTNRIFTLDVSWFLKISLPTLLMMSRASGQYFLLLRNVNEK